MLTLYFLLLFKDEKKSPRLSTLKTNNNISINNLSAS